MGWQDHILIDPETPGSEPRIKGSGVAVHLVIESLAEGMAIDEVCRKYGVTQDDIGAALDYAAEILVQEQDRAFLDL